MRNYIIKNYKNFYLSSFVIVFNLWKSIIHRIRILSKALGPLLKLIPAFSLLSINNLYLGSSRSLAYK